MKTLSNSDLGATLRIIDREGQPWFVAKDICEAIGIQQTGPAIAKLDEDEVNQIHLVDPRGQSQKTYIVSESGLYAMILRSDKPAATQFRKWVTSQVLPEIRKTGSYLGGWEGELRGLESDCAAARALLEESEDRLQRFRRIVADRLGFSSGVLELAEPQTMNAPDGSKPSSNLIALARKLPLPSKTKPLVEWLIQTEKINEKAARQRLLRMYRTGLIVQGTDRIVRLQTNHTAKP